MKPFYTLDQVTKNIVLELIRKCEKLQLGNINFQYFFTAKTHYEVYFYMTEYNAYWELVVKKSTGETDVYKIADGTINYNYSEKD